MPLKIDNIACWLRHLLADQVLGDDERGEDAGEFRIFRAQFFPFITFKQKSRVTVCLPLVAAAPYVGLYRLGLRNVDLERQGRTDHLKILMPPASRWVIPILHVDALFPFN